jgi:hypothetical protein
VADGAMDNRARIKMGNNFGVTFFRWGILQLYGFVCWLSASFALDLLDMILIFLEYSGIEII